MKYLQKWILVTMGGLVPCFSLSAQILQTIGPSSTGGATSLVAINSSGVAVGTSQGDPTNYFGTAGIYSSGGGTLNYIGNGFADDNAYAITNSGTALASVNGDPFLYNIPTNTLTSVNSLLGAVGIPSDGNYVVDINDSDEILGGNYFTTSGYIYSNGTVTNLPGVYVQAINDAGQVIGLYPNSSDSFIYSGGTFTDLGSLGGEGSQAWALNNLGDVVGTSQVIDTSTANVSDPFLYSNGVMTDLGNFGLYYGVGGGVAYGVNDSDEIVGDVIGGIDSQENFIYDPFLYVDGRMWNMNQLFSSLLSNGTTPGFLDFDTAEAINDAGQIVGTGDYWDGSEVIQEGYILDSAEFPIADTGSSAALLLLGLAPLLVWRRRRFRDLAA